MKFYTTLNSVNESTPVNLLPISDDGFLYVLAFGQSNMVGKYPESLADSSFYAGNRTDPINTSVPNMVGGWKSATYGVSPFNNYNNNIALSFCREMNVRYPNVPIRLVFQAFGGKSIVEWLITGSQRPALDAIYNTFKSGGIFTNSIRKAGLVIMHQGEEDKNMLTVDYLANHTEVINQFKTEGYVVSSGEHFVCGEIGYVNAQVTSNLKAITDQSESYLLTLSDGLEKGDQSHFLGTGLSDFGIRYVNKYEEIIIGATPPTDIERPTSPTLTIDSFDTNNVNLSWTAGTDNVEIVGYDVYSQNGYIYHSSYDAVTFSATIPWIKAIGEIERFCILSVDSSGNKTRFTDFNLKQETRP